jgi:hypothetical protein
VKFVKGLTPHSHHPALRTSLGHAVGTRRAKDFENITPLSHDHNAELRRDSQRYWLNSVLLPEMEADFI